MALLGKDKMVPWIIVGALVVSGAAWALASAAVQITGSLCTAFMEPIKAGAANNGFADALLLLVAGDAIGGAAATLALTMVGLDLLPAILSAGALDALADALAWIAC